MRGRNRGRRVGPTDGFSPVASVASSVSGDPIDNANPTTIRSVAISVPDVVAALEARRRTGRRAVLRVTPPFSGRMRARLHVARGGADDDASLHIHPGRLVTGVSRYPEPAGTGEPPPDAGTDGRDRAPSVVAWRDAVRDGIVDEVRLPGTDHRVAVTALGGEGRGE